MSSPSKLHDPLFHYETHFPERLSRLHLGNEFGHAGSIKKLRKTRQRTGVRYKTQPVTFDEIIEVDEEPTSEDKGSTGSVEGQGRSGRGLMGQFQAFSRSMDGLLPRIPEQSVQLSLAGPARRHHIDRPPSIPSIPEKIETAKSPDIILAAGAGGGAAAAASSPSANPFFPSSSSSSSPIPIPSAKEDRLPQLQSGEATSGQGQKSLTVHGGEREGGGEEEGGGGGGGGGSAAQPPIPSPNIASRRQKVTAKAKKRQKAAGDQGASDT